MDSFEAFKAAQKQGWAHFAPLEMVTTLPAARLVKFAGVKPGQQVLDVACGTGVVAVTAARIGASVTALDLTPELLQRARQNAEIAGVKVDWHEGDVEKLPFGGAQFDVVLSQFGHMFALRPALAISEMLRVPQARRHHCLLDLASGTAHRQNVPLDCRLHAASTSRSCCSAAVGRPERHPRAPRRRRPGRHVRTRFDAHSSTEPAALPSRHRTHRRTHGEARRKSLGKRSREARSLPSRIRHGSRRILPR